MTDHIGRFEVIEKIGEGGMGAVFKARDPHINRVVAIKLLREGFDNNEMRERFMREAQAAGGLQNPYIVTIFELGDHRGSPYIVMEFVVGEPLDRLIRKHVPLSPVRRLELMEALCSGLATAHRAGVIHRDIKPSNLMVVPDGLLKILDFGIARVIDTSQMTKVGTLIGTPNYMSPEQLNGSGVDKRTDVFSAGAVFYELFAYEQAFPGSSPTEVITRVLTREPAPLSEIVPRIDPSIAAVVERALRKERGERFADLTDMRRQIREIRVRLEREARARGDEASARTGVLDLGASIDAGGIGEAQRRAYAEIDAAHELFDDGRVTNAIRRLEAFTPHELVADALAALRDRADERERQIQRDAAIQRAVHSASEAFDRGDFEAALQAAHDALVLDERSIEARDVRRRARAAIDEQRRVAHERDARVAVSAARARFDAGDHRAAIESLEAFAPAHSLVLETLGALRERLATLERRGANTAGPQTTTLPPAPAPQSGLTPGRLSAVAGAALTIVAAVVYLTMSRGSQKASPPAAVPPPTSTPTSVAATTTIQVAAPPVTIRNEPERGRRGREPDDQIARGGSRSSVPAAAPRPAAVTSAVTTIPVSEPPQPPAVTSAPPSVLPTSAPTSIPPTTSIAPAPTITVQMAQAIVDQYAAAYRVFNLDAIRRVYPGFPENDQKRLAAQRQAFAYCTYEFRSPTLAVSSPDASRYEADGVESCKPKTAQPALPLGSHHIFDLRRTPSGWVIVQHLF